MGLTQNPYTKKLLKRRWTALQRFLEPLVHLLFGILWKPRTLSAQWLRGQRLASPAQELNLGGVTPAPNAIAQMNPYDQALVPRKPGVHGL
jgi:hypothetical protein